MLVELIIKEPSTSELLLLTMFEYMDVRIHLTDEQHGILHRMIDPIVMQ